MRGEQANRTARLRDALGVPRDDDDRSFEQQMKDLGVEVVKPKVTWYKPMTQKRGKVGGLKDKISLNKGGFTFGSAVVEKIGADLFFNFGLYDKGGKKAIIIQQSKKDGLKMHITKSKSYRVSSKTLVKWLLEQGMPLGKYKIHEVKGGFLAVPEGGVPGGR